MPWPRWQAHPSCPVALGLQAVTGLCLPCGPGSTHSGGSQAEADHPLKLFFSIDIRSVWFSRCLSSLAAARCPAGPARPAEPLGKYKQLCCFLNTTNPIWVLGSCRIQGWGRGTRVPSLWDGGPGLAAGEGSCQGTAEAEQVSARSAPTRFPVAAEPHPVPPPASYLLTLCSPLWRTTGRTHGAVCSLIAGTQEWGWGLCCGISALPGWPGQTQLGVRCQRTQPHASIPATFLSLGPSHSLSPPTKPGGPSPEVTGFPQACRPCVELCLWPSEGPLHGVSPAHGRNHKTNQNPCSPR